MRVCVNYKNSELTAKSSRDYYSFERCGGGTKDAVGDVKKLLITNINDPLSALELKHDYHKNTNFGAFANRMAHMCIYIVFDKATGEAYTFVDDFAKGYGGEGARGALTMDTYIDLLNIPINRKNMSRESVFIVPTPKKPKFTLENLARAKQRARRAHMEIDPRTKGGFAVLYEGMPLDEMLSAMDFHQLGS